MMGLVKLVAKPLLLAPFYALYGAWRLLWAAVGGARWIADAPRLLSNSIRCPSCGEDNPLHGRWNCDACHGVYHGFVGTCAICGTAAATFPCCRCGITLVLRRSL